MDPTTAILISSDGIEETVAIADLKRGDPFPMVLIKNGKPSAGIPSKVFRLDNTEVAKRYWTVAVYREATALYI